MSRSIGENFKKKLLYFFELSPFADLDFEICNHDILKSITAWSFKLGHLICRSIGENLKKGYFILFELSPFADLDFENL